MLINIYIGWMQTDEAAGKLREVFAPVAGSLSAALMPLKGVVCHQVDLLLHMDESKFGLSAAYCMQCQCSLAWLSSHLSAVAGRVLYHCAAYLAMQRQDCRGMACG